jgi:hypothetical protein
VIRKLPIIGFITVSTVMGLAAVAFLAVVKAIEEAHDHEYFWE